ncbi:MAG: GNAT family N-acetyltransferase [Microbacteriaceae bacterium]|nr:GNAT family N-acetyltransferase [Microbacteriaceae bacterium]
MLFRRAMPDDWEQAREVRILALTSDPIAFCSNVEKERQLTESDWRRRLTESYTVLGWNGRIPVATATGKVDQHETGAREMVGVWLDPSSRGTDAASRLVKEIIDWARVERATALSLWVMENNVRAKRFYQRIGFVETGEKEEAKPGVYEVRMKRAFNYA